MEWYHWTLVALAVLAIVSAWRVPRAVLWVGLGAFVYYLTAAWHNAGFPAGVWVGAASNFAMIVLITRYGEDRNWEWMLGNAFALMTLIDLFHAAGYATRLQFAVALEIVNAAALLMIAGTGIVQRIRDGELVSGLADCVAVRRSHHAAFARARPYPHWWKD